MESTSLQIAEYLFEIDIYDHDFILLRSTSCQELPALAREIYQKQFSFITEVIGSEKEICLKLGASFKQENLSELKRLSINKKDEKKGLRFPIHFSKTGDWDLIQASTLISREQYIDQIINSDLKLCMYGFLPGFLYMDGLPEKLHVPRKRTPSIRMEAGTIAVGGKYLGVYNFPSPGGWNIIGKTPIRTFDLEEEGIISIPIGTEIEIISISEEQLLVETALSQDIIEYNS